MLFDKNTILEFMKSKSNFLQVWIPVVDFEMTVYE